MPAKHGLELGVAAALLLTSLPAAARAELALSATLASDWRYRGVSFSDGRPSLGLTASYDHRSGLYASVMGLAADTRHDGVQALGYQAYAGYSTRLKSGASLDLGVTHADFETYGAPGGRITYSEAYAGLSARDVSAHVFYSPDYLRTGVRTLYVSLDGARLVGRRVRLFGHAGLIAPLGSTPAYGAGGLDARYDLRAGAAVRRGPLEFQLAWSHLGPGRGYRPDAGRRRDALIAAATWAF